MTTWSGWAPDFLAAASLPNTANNRKFLNDWAANANHPGCGNNPIDLTRHETGSSNCAATGKTGVNVQRYTSHTWARTAFNSQVHSGNYAALLAAFKSGNPFSVGSPGPVATDLGQWSSTKYANVYLNAAGEGSPASAVAPQALKGWADIRRSANKHLPAALHQSDKTIKAAMRAVSTASKV